MGLSINVLRVFVMSLFLAVYDLTFKWMWYETVERYTGFPPGIGQIALGYFVIVTVAYMFTYFLSHKLESEAE